jgi:uncharacterized RDD family membrane protein YckC
MFTFGRHQTGRDNFYNLISIIMNYNTRSELHHSNEFILATIRKRFVAFLIDWIVLIMIYFCIIVLFGLFKMNISNINVHGIFDVEVEIDNMPPYLITFFKYFFGLLPVIYFTISFYFWKGKTVGKYFLRIKVISLYHEHIGLWHCIERSLGYFASALEFGFGFIQAFWNPNRMTLHDKIGETIVVERPAKKHK